MARFKKLFEHRNRGILLDVVVFLFSLLLMRVLVGLSVRLIHLSDQGDRSATVVIGLFLAGLFFLQPLGPKLKRWSFHQRNKSFQLGANGNAGCLLIGYLVIYALMMVAVAEAATIILVEAFPGMSSAWGSDIATVCILSAFVLSIVNAVTIYRYFLTPKKEPHLKFLMSPQAELLGDMFMFFNVICFQVLWGCIVASEIFWEMLQPTSHGKAPGFVGGLIFRVFVVAITALVIYFPPRIFYLALDQRRKITWLTMLIANLPLIFAIVFFSPHTSRAQPPNNNSANVISGRKPLINPAFNVTAEDFYKEYKLDYIAGAKKYAGKVVNVSGNVHSIEADKGQPHGVTLELDGGGPLKWVICHFDEDQQQVMKRLAKQQNVTIQGVGTDYWIGGPTLKNCLSVEPQL